MVFCSGSLLTHGSSEEIMCVYVFNMAVYVCILLLLMLPILASLHSLPVQSRI